MRDRRRVTTDDDNDNEHSFYLTDLLLTVVGRLHFFRREYEDNCIGGIKLQYI